MKVKEYLVFTRRERSGIISLAILVLVVIVIPKFIDRRKAVTENIPVAETQDTFKRKSIVTLQKPQTPDFTRKKAEPFDINAADTSAFIALPGIGSKLAARIILFREKLGGFYSVAQIREVYGIQDTVYQKILPMLKCKPGNIKRIDINKAEKETLKAHPYIRWQTANELVAYRNQHGSFQSADDLDKLENIDKNALKKMMPYISFK